ncbi:MULTISPECIES: WhiB family transcriptional regulator [Streptomyces]|uniref:WhiB family transcriptional regulator n=1 Tax=Streptomyces lycopersici TaxID=2974589 RepID=UPI0021CFD978|nr:WhiB family transcriptional regulator [Streptomyces sp. NEAU-383]
MAVPRRSGVLIAATSQPVPTASDWRSQMAERASRSTVRLDANVVQRAACAGVDPETFFVREADTAAVELAKGICRGCPVLRECLMQGLRSNDHFAILGGTTPEERRLIRRRVAYKRAVAA